MTHFRFVLLDLIFLTKVMGCIPQSTRKEVLFLEDVRETNATHIHLPSSLYRSYTPISGVPLYFVRIDRTIFFDFDKFERGRPTATKSSLSHLKLI